MTKTYQSHGRDFSIKDYTMILKEERIRDAATHAQNIWRGFNRTGTKIPYFDHLANVAFTVKQEGGSTEQVIAAFLYSVSSLGHHNNHMNQIKETYGEEVFKLVVDCSEYKQASLSPKAAEDAYIGKIESNIEPEAVPIVLAAKLDLAEHLIKAYLSRGEHVWSDQKAPKIDLIHYYNRIYGALTVRLTGRSIPLLDRYGRVVKVLKGLI